MTNIRNKKILVISECFYPETFKINDLVFDWAKTGNEVTVITLAPSYPAGRLYDGHRNRLLDQVKINNVNIIRLYAILGYRESVVRKVIKYLYFMLFSTIIALCIGKKFNIIFGYNLGPLTDMFSAVVCGRIFKKPVYLWVQDVWPETVFAYGFKKRWLLEVTLKKFVNFMYSNVTRVAISSKGFEKKLRPFVQKDLGYLYAPNWPDKISFGDKAVKLGDKSVIQFSFTGNVGKVQNLENVLSAFVSINPKLRSKAQFNVIGDGSELERLKNLFSQYSNIVFHGRIQQKDMGGYFNASHFLVVSLMDQSVFYSTVPGKLQTYIAAGKPILGAIKGESADIINTFNLGFTAAPSDLLEIQMMFEKCLSLTKQDLMDFSVNSKNLLENRFNQEKIISSITQDVNNCLELF